MSRGSSRASTSTLPPTADRIRPWAGPVGLAVVLGFAALTSSWNIGYSGLSTYYAAAAKSMASSPHALVFGALDPAASITLDKLSGFLLPQALSVAVFGFHAWSLSLPQVIEGLVTVSAGCLIGTRWRGRGYGLAIAAALATTPMLAAMFGRPMEDGMVTMCEVLAFAALQRAVQVQRLRWLVLAGLWIAVGFQAKMMQSWLFLPALVLAYGIGSRAPLKTRLVHITVALGVCVLASVAWTTAIQLVPSGARPFIDGTTDDDVSSMVFGYNGFDRLLHGIVPGAVPQLNAGVGTGGTVANHTRTAVAGASPIKLLLPQFSTQIGWLYPLAVTGVVVAARDRAIEHRTPTTANGAVRTRTAAATEVGLAVWLGVAVVVLSLAFVPHATYFGVIALPIAAFAVHGAARAVAAYRSSRTWIVLPVVVAVQGAWAASVAASTVAQLRPLAVLLLVAGLGSAIVLIVARAHGSARLVRFGLVAGLVASVLGPLTWSAFPIGSGGGGSASDAFAGPRIGADGSVPLIAIGHHPGLIHLHRPFSAPADDRLSAADGRLLRYVDARNAPGAIPFASDSLPVVVSVILGSSASPLPMGGFSKQAPEPTLGALIRLVETHRLRYVLLQDPQASSPLPPNAVMAAVRHTIRVRCSVAMSGEFRERSRQRQTLYDCRVAAAGLQGL